MTRPRLIIVDVDSRLTRLARAVKDSLDSFFLVREETLSHPLERSRRVSGAGEPGEPAEEDITCAVVCASAIDSASERRITHALSRWDGFPTVLVSHAADSDVLSRLNRVSRAPTLILPSDDILLRMVRLLSCAPSESVSVDAGAGNHPELARLVGGSEVMQTLRRTLLLAASCDAPVIIVGETGTGKGVCATLIHDLSARSAKRFVPVNCGTIRGDLTENELFGHASEAFTGAARSREGLVQAAEGGTLFLDEVTALPVAVQVALLRLLEEKEFRPLGSPETLQADLRVLAATNEDLLEAVRDGRMRKDFYYRLNGFNVEVAPLRERPEDILELAHHFVREYAGPSGRPVPSISSDAAEKLLNHDWPGNVRELKNTVERAVLHARNSRFIAEHDIRLLVRRESPEETFLEEKARVVAEFERRRIESLLIAHAGNVSRAADAAGMHRRSFRALMRKRGVDAQRFRESR